MFNYENYDFKSVFGCVKESKELEMERVRDGK